MRFLLCFCLFVMLINSGLSCGGDDSLSSSVDVFIDRKPRVFTSKKRVPSISGGEDVEITPPYFSFQPSIRNRHEKH